MLSQTLFQYGFSRPLTDREFYAVMLIGLVLFVIAMALLSIAFRRFTNWLERRRDLQHRGFDVTPNTGGSAVPREVKES